jgi:hypothetical protein
MAGFYPITIRKGATFVRTIGWFDDNDAAVALTGYRAALEVRPYAGHVGTPYVQAQTNPKPGGAAGDGRITVASDGYTLTINLPSSYTSGLAAWTTAVWDLKLEDPATGVIYVLLEGPAFFEPSVTV